MVPPISRMFNGLGAGVAGRGSFSSINGSRLRMSLSSAALLQAASATPCPYGAVSQSDEPKASVGELGLELLEVK